MPIDQLDFLYGAIAFKHTISKTETELEFEIENDAIRPEFDVLKPYFSKVLKSKQVEISLFAEFENGRLVSQSASSPHLEKINREIIEGVKFRFLEKGIIGKQFVSGAKDNLLDLSKLQEGQTGKPLYGSEEQLLNDLLKNKNIKHYQQLRYLAGKHDGSILKLRFVLSPFSFVFLLRGADQYHIILETLDTEEATYIWHTRLPVRHIENDRLLLSQKLLTINEDLNLIRNIGRQAFLENPPEHFSRLIHDYSDERKGFIVWKDQLEERLL